MDKLITALVSTFFAWIACFALAGVVCWIYGSSRLEGFPALLAIAVWWLPPVFVFLKTSGIWDSIASERARQKYLVEERKRNEENRKAEIERAKQQEIWQAEQTKQRLAAQQLALQNTLASLASDSVHLAANLPSLAREAEQRLDLAEHEFKEGVFPTFWDAVEGAANKLATFNNDIQCIVANALQHKQLAPTFSGSPPQFRIGVDTLPDATHTAERMKLIVRKAQKSPDFAKIYEMRRTNQLLVSGFSSLGQAISDLSQNIRASIRDLEDSLMQSLSDLASQQKDSAAEALSEIRLAREQAQTDAAEARELSERQSDEAAQRADRESAAKRASERKEQEMLDDIRRRRKPLPPGLRDGEF